MTHPLDKPIWSALNGCQARFAQGGVLAKIFPDDVSPFAAACDNSPEAVTALSALVLRDVEVSLLEVAPPDAPRPIQATTRAGLQMTAAALSAGGRAAPIEALGEADAADMLALATLTRPGPFRARTHTMGRFLGIRDGARLLAMGGERLTMDGFTEVTALCTHPDYRGRGFGEALLRAIAQRLLDEGATPFLHSYADNAGALALYRRTGFVVRAEVSHAIWQRRG